MHVLLVIGDQDTYHEDDSEVGSSPIWIADILRDEGLTGLFVVQARRAEILREQHRHDVIQAVRQHEVGLHGRDVHPALPEVVEGLGWDQGVAALLAVEGSELELLGQVFDVDPVCSSQHRHQAAPQAFGMARQLGLPYLFGYPAAPPHHAVSWYAGALSVPLNTSLPNFLGFFPAVFDDALPDPGAFAALFGQLRTHVDRCQQAGLPLLVVFICHPERLCYTGPLEQWQYSNGVNHGRADIPPGVEQRRSRLEIDQALANFRIVVRYLRDTPGLEPTTVRDMVRQYGHQSSVLRRSELAALAAQSVAERRIPVGTSFSMAEAVLGLADGLARYGHGERLPEMTPRVDVLGPIEAPPLAPELPGLNMGELMTLAEALGRTASESGHLPASLATRGRRIGLGSLYGALALGYQTLAAADALDPQAGVELAAWPRYPDLGLALGACHRLCTEDPLVRPGLSTDAAALHAQLQTWTLKAARREQGQT